MAHAVNQLDVAHILVLQPPRKCALPQPELARRLGATRHTAVERAGQPLLNPGAQLHGRRQPGQLHRSMGAVQLR
jgi:hypothetical protein